MGILSFLSVPLSWAYLDTVCIGDKGSLYGYASASPYQTVIIWNVEGTDEGRVNVVEYNDTLRVDWIDPKPGTAIISVREFSYFADSLQCEGATILDSVYVSIPPSVHIEDQYVCAGLSTHFTSDETNYVSYLWSNGSTMASSAPYSTEGNVWVRVTDAYGCKDTDTAYLTVRPLPVVDLGADLSLCGENEYVLDAGTDGIIYSWYFDSRLYKKDIENTITLTENLKLWERFDTVVVSVLDQWGCISYDTLLVLPCAFDIGEIPNIITPNGDGFNDTWRIRRVERYRSTYNALEITVYDRWGKLVYRSEPGYPKPWDGTDLRGKALPADAYFYVIDLKKEDVPVITGHVTIVR